MLFGTVTAYKGPTTFVRHLRRPGRFDPSDDGDSIRMTSTPDSTPASPADPTNPADERIAGETGQEYLARRGLGALAVRMGIEFPEFTPSRAVATMPVEGNTQPMGLVHGGAYVVLAESLGSMHANFLAPEGHAAVGVDINATHTASATAGIVTGVCTPIHLGRTLTVHEIAITDERGRRCSTVRITNLYKRVA